ncbi:MAG: 50S ribosomal protein L29 [Candidatus Thalassarchaeaceae archaeon]|jgi:ribosomal protein L29|nr:50S ribosomal protein L29 [Candidatus Thalassarchaeaceae archaeon]
MSHVSSRDIESMSSEQLHRTLEDLKDELLQLRGQQALGGSSSNSGSYKQTRRSIARVLTKINQENRGGE